MANNKSRPFITVIKTDKHGIETRYKGIQAAADANYVPYNTMSSYLAGRWNPCGDMAGVEFRRGDK